MYYLFGKVNCTKSKDIKDHLIENKKSLFFIPTGTEIPYLGLVKDVLEKYSDKDFPILVKRTGEDSDYKVIKDYKTINKEAE